MSRMLEDKYGYNKRKLNEIMGFAERINRRAIEMNCIWENEMHLNLPDDELQQYFINMRKIILCFAEELSEVIK